MKILILLFSALCGSFLLGSCCSDEECLGANDIGEIEIYGFSDNELDTVIFMSFNKNSGFTTPLDSYKMIVYHLYADRSSAYTEGNLNIGLDYKVSIPGIGKSYTITNFTKSSEKCNTGLFCNDKYDKLTGYDLNGERKEGSAIRIQE